ncbi:MAG: CHAT domain-containing protein [Alphaproteobacteria bacterium]|nr:CHAT domain-containing protein [Alphaproteobacteria bacterium]
MTANAAHAMTWWLICGKWDMHREVVVIVSRGLGLIAATLALSLLLPCFTTMSGSPAKAQAVQPQAESEAIRRARDELASARAANPSGGQAILTPLSRLGWALVHGGRAADAIPVFQEQIEIAGRTNPGQTLPRAWANYNLGEALRRLNRHSDAIPFLTVALDLRKALLKSDDIDLAWAHYAIGESRSAVGHATEALPDLRTALGIANKAKGVESLESATIALELANTQRDLTQFREAAQSYGITIANRAKHLGADDPSTFLPLLRLGFTEINRGDYAAAETAFSRLDAAVNKRLGADSLWAGNAAHGLAEVLYYRGNLKAAQDKYRHGLMLRQKHAPDSVDVGYSFTGLGFALWTGGQPTEAEAAFRRAAAQFERIGRGRQDDAAYAQLSLGRVVSLSTTRFAEAREALDKAADIYRRLHGDDDLRVANVYAAYAGLDRRQENFTQAETMARQALLIRERILGANHLQVAFALRELAGIHTVRAKYQPAEELLRRAISIFRGGVGTVGPDFGDTLTDLGWVYLNQGRLSDAADMFRQAIAGLESSVGPEHPSTAYASYSLAIIKTREGDHAEAEALHRRALAIRERTFGAQHPQTIISVMELALASSIQGKTAQAWPMFERAVAGFRGALGDASQLLALAIDHYAGARLRQGEFARAEALARQGLAIRERSLGPDHLRTGWSLARVGATLERQDKLDEALSFVRRATSLYRARGEAMRLSEDASGADMAEQIDLRGHFIDHVSILYRLAQASSANRAALTAEAFEILQLAQATGTEAAISKMAARFASGSDALGSLVRRREETTNLWRAADAKLVRLLASGSAGANDAEEARAKAQVDAFAARLRELSAELTRQFPEYADLASPRPATLAETQGLLKPDEAMVIWLVGARQTHILVVRGSGVHFLRTDIGRRGIDEIVRKLRLGVDPSAVNSLDDLPVFDTGLAHQFYQRIFAPIEPHLTGAKTVFAVTDGGLQSLPLGVLVREPTPTAKRKVEDYANLPWLAASYGFSVLPSAGSLKSLRRFAKSAHAPEPFLGIGDPILADHPSESRSSSSKPGATRSVVAVATDVKSLPSLPDTADELRAMASTLKAPESALRLGQAATETEVKRIRLERYRVLAFATHGLMADEFASIGEPALVLTPPTTSTEADDGLLTASEIAKLKLDADWVILSACNTAAADGTPGAEGLSGLAKAFFYAGARTLLVSHWAVLSEAAVKLTTSMLAEASANPKLSRAGAHQAALFAVMKDRERPYLAHPIFWAPFTVVGEGGA